jgi:glycosyltransferase involved in cell wall biosynthesis
VRVLMASQFYPPVVGGQEQVVYNLSTVLARRGHDVSVATLQLSGPEYELDAGVRVHRMGGTLQRFDKLYRDAQRRHVPPAPDPQLVREFGRLIDREQPDVVHAHDWLVHSVLGVARRKHVPLVLSLHDYGLICANKRLDYRGGPCAGPALGKCMRCSIDSYGLKGVPVVVALRAGRSRTWAKVDRFLPVSEAVATLTGLRASGAPFTVLPNFVPDRVLQTDHAGERSSDLPSDGYVCFVGDVTRDKGVAVLLEAHRRLGHEPPLVLVGRPLLEAVQRPLPNVLVLGRRPHSFVLEALRRCGVAVVPSVCAETFSLAALEAMVMGRPVVASRVGGLADVVRDGETGVLTAPGDAGALADALAALLADPRRREELGASGRRRAEESYGEGVVVPMIERVYDEVIAASRVMKPL